MGQRGVLSNFTYSKKKMNLIMFLTLLSFVFVFVFALTLVFSPERLYRQFDSSKELVSFLGRRANRCKHFLALLHRFVQLAPAEVRSLMEQVLDHLERNICT
jgi:hypothetical protein